MLRSSLAAAFSAVLAAGIAQSVAAQEAAEQRLGAVHFETSCNDAAQRRFDRGMRYQHSFWYRASKEIFEDTLKADPDCAIAYWGIATSLLLNPFGVPPAANLAEGLAAIQKAKAIGAKTPRENEFIGALGAFYADYDKLDHRTRVQAYLKAMEAVAQRYPQDDEAQIYYALALDVAASPADKTYANQLKAAAILEGIFKRSRNIPASRTISFTPTTTRPSPTKASTPPRAIPRSRRRRRTRSTCRPTSSPVSATGRNRSPLIQLRCVRPRPTRSTATSSTVKTTWCTPICSSRRTRTRAP